MPTSALYYPHTIIRSRELIRTSLLLWDFVECIVPTEDWRIETPFSENNYNEALELIIRKKIPSEQHRSQAHSDVESFIKEEGARFFLENTLNGTRKTEYLIYQQKFFDHTWYLLEQYGLARLDELSSDYGVPPALGLLMMSSLADACAGSQKQKVTDRVLAYSLLERARATWMGAPFVEGLDASQVAPSLDRLISLSLQVLDARSIPIKKLLEFRKREARSNSTDYRKMRLNYMRNLHIYINRITNEAKTKDDVEEIEREFKADLKDDLRNLKQELSLASIEPLLSKEMVITAMILGGAFLEPISGLTTLAASLKGVGVIPLVKTHLQHRKARRKALLGHNISWLYLTKENRLRIR